MEIVIPIVTGLVRYYSDKQQITLYDIGSLESQIAKMGKFRDIFMSLLAKSWNIA